MCSPWSWTIQAVKLKEFWMSVCVCCHSFLDEKLQEASQQYPARYEACDKIYVDNINQSTFRLIILKELKTNKNPTSNELMKPAWWQSIPFPQTCSQYFHACEPLTKVHPIVKTTFPWCLRWPQQGFHCGATWVYQRPPIVKTPFPWCLRWPQQGFHCRARWENKGHSKWRHPFTVSRSSQVVGR